jgi:hypothetical protein
VLILFSGRFRYFPGSFPPFHHLFLAKWIPSPPNPFLLNLKVETPYSLIKPRQCLFNCLKPVDSTAQSWYFSRTCKYNFGW